MEDSCIIYMSTAVAGGSLGQSDNWGFPPVNDVCHNVVCRPRTPVT